MMTKEQFLKQLEKALKNNSKRENGYSTYYNDRQSNMLYNILRKSQFIANC
ncbi:MAG TPA: hypothetical protein VKY40_09995 [Halanaerobiales bacterium]|nr:hypothetical protein [Halanaerobiales bacterium]